MNKEEIQKLYKEKILPESRNDAHFRETLPKGIKAYNPMCGDKFNLHVETENGMIKSILFSGHGCALSKASTSMLAEYLEGMSLGEARNLATGLVNQVNNTEPATAEFPAKLETLVSLKDFEGRTDCITLSWKAFAEATTHD